MARHKVSAETAFAMLVRAPQHSNTKLRDVSLQLAKTGEFSP